MADILLRTEGLTKKFGALTANDQISFSVSEGEIRGLIGPNGSGKSTFFNTVTGYYKPTDGNVYFDGTEITSWANHKIARNGLVRTFQIVSPFEDLTIRENLLAAYTGGFRIPLEKRERADEILEFLEIDHLADNEASEMSGGQQKLLELGRVLMLDPECILLDEPTAGVNPALQEEILGHLKEMNETGTTFVIVEHDMGVIEDIADTVSVFANGQYLTEGDFEEVKNDDRVRSAYLGTDDDSEVNV